MIHFIIRFFFVIFLLKNFPSTILFKKQYIYFWLEFIFDLINSMKSDRKRKSVTLLSSANVCLENSLWDTYDCIESWIIFPCVKRLKITLTTLLRLFVDSFKGSGRKTPTIGNGVQLYRLKFNTAFPIFFSCHIDLHKDEYSRSIHIRTSE